MATADPIRSAALVALLLCAACVTEEGERLDWVPEFDVSTTAERGSVGFVGAAWSQDPTEEPAEVDAPTGQDPDAAARLRARFGSHIMIQPDGRVTKEYFLSGEAGSVFMSLLREPGAAAPKPRVQVTVGGASGSKSVLGDAVGQMSSTNRALVFVLVIAGMIGLAWLVMTLVR